MVKDENVFMLLILIIEFIILGYSFEEMYNYLYRRGFIIYLGKICLINIFRIVNIGEIY